MPIYGMLVQSVVLCLVCPDWRNRMNHLALRRSNLRGFNIGPLPLVWPYLRQLKIAEFVDAHCPSDAQAEFSHGEIVQAMVACRLYNPVALYRVDAWARQDGAEQFLGIAAEKLNDDRLGRTLDAIFPHRYSILGSIACAAAAEFHIPLEKLHYDPTHFLFYGEYENQRDAPDLLKVTWGRHHRPGQSIKEAQVGVNVASDGLGSIPLFFITGCGKENHRALAARNLELLQKHVRPQKLLLIEDRGSFSHAHGFTLRDQGFQFISSLPWSEDLQAVLKTIPQNEFETSRFLSIAETKKRQASKPASTWEYYRVAERPHLWKAPDKKGGRDMEVRLLFVHSTADEKAARKARQKYTQKIRQGLWALQASVAKGCRHTDPASVANRVAKVMGHKSAARYFDWAMTPLSDPERNQLPPPGRGRRRPTHRLVFRYHEAQAQADAQWDGYYALATNVPRSEKKADDIFCAFKGQSHLDVAHHQMKAPLRIHPVFLHRQERIEALVLVLFLALMVFYLLQREYRRRGPAGDRTTAETLMRAFSTLGLLLDRERLLTCALSTQQSAIMTRLRLPDVADQIAQNRARLNRSP